MCEASLEACEDVAVMEYKITGGLPIKKKAVVQVKTTTPSMAWYFDAYLKKMHFPHHVCINNKPM